LVAGTVPPGQADVIVTAVNDLPSGDLVRRRGERLLVTEAARLNGSQLARAGRHLAHVVDPDATDRRLEAALDREERAAHLGRYLAITPDRAGGVWIKGHGSAEDGALLTAALLPLTRPEPATPEGRTSYETDDGGEACAPGQDLFQYGARVWDALVTLARHGLATPLVPDTHATPPRLLITLDHHQLKDDLQAAGIATTADGTDLPPAALRRLACDAELVPAVLGGRSEVLDVGRTRRLVTPALWTALILRDRHCTFPACDRPPVMCHAHHLTHWADGGTTSLENLALVCGHHHRTLHHTPWQIRLNPEDRKPEYKPPHKPGVTPQWTRYRPRLE
jgi:hypothetical protein